MTWQITRSWLLLTVGGIAMYVALFTVGVLGSPLTELYLPSSGVWAVALGALAVAILLALDEHQAPGEENIEKMTFAGLAYVLFVKRKALLALLVLSIVGVGLVGFYVSKWIGVTLETEGTTLSIKLPGQTVYYFPISSQQGWQNTGLTIKKDQKFMYSITGYVSPGYLQDIDKRIEELRKHIKSNEPYLQGGLEWPFTGPEGYLENWYEKKAEEDKKKCDNDHPKDKDSRGKCYITKSFKGKGENRDQDLTVLDVAHNQVVGIILPSGSTPRDPSVGEQRYDYGNPEDEKMLILFKSTRIDREAPKTVGTILRKNAEGVLWVVINDADNYRWDNAGLFFLKLVTP